MEYIKNNSYEDYVSEQTKLNKAKLHIVWVLKSNVVDIKSYCDKHGIDVQNVICHGTRNGRELYYFNDVFPGVGVLGTEISDTATQFPNTIQWDFHDLKDEWVNQFDIVYTNSWDHSYDLEKALESWMKTLSDNGRLFLDWNEDTLKPTNKADCCGCSLEKLHEVINKKYIVEDTFKIENQHKKEAHMVVVKNK